MNKKPGELFAVIAFDGGFDADLLTFNINTFSIIKKKMVSSDSSDGVTNVEVRLYKEGSNLRIKVHNNDKISYEIPMEKELLLEIIVNDTHKEFNVDPSKGKFIYIKQSDKRIELNQNQIQNIYD